MISCYQKVFVFIAVCLIFAFPARQHASPSGTISGCVRDQETGYPLPGASIIVEGTTFGAMADKNGRYIIYNLPAGNYSLRATMIGYVPTKVTDVQVKTDLNTPIDFSLLPQVLQVPEEIVITAPRIEIYKDVVSSLHYVGEQQLAMALPVQNFQEALPLVPGFVANHFRGGRLSNTLYLIDGLPASGPLTRDLAFMVQNTSIAEMVVQTGGFSPEYGNVSGGMVNIITKEGRNHFHGMTKFATDVVGQYDNRAFDNSRRAEFTIGGPLTLGLGGPVVDTNYLISGGANFTDTPHREAMRQAFNSPVVFNYDLNTKLAIRANKNLYLRGQVLLSDWDWRQYDTQWDDRLSALPKRQNRNLRLSLSLTHTLSAAMFYKLDLVSMDLQRNVFGEVLAGAPSNLPLKNRSLASVWPGATEPWFEQRREKQYTAHLSLVRQLNPSQQIKAGFESNRWDLQLDRSRYLLWPAAEQDSDFVYSRYDDSFRQFPYTVASYFQYKIDLAKVVFNVGARYELFSPNAGQAPLPTESGETDSVGVEESKSNAKQTLAPRFSLAIPISEVEHLSFNYGWFYELPPLYYLYLNRAGEQNAYWSLFGNTDLKPIRSKAWEINYRRVASPQSIYSLSFFYRQYDNLLDTSPYLFSTTATVDNSMNTLRYENRASASMAGFEVAFKHDFGKGFNGALYYTYLKSTGTASWPESGLLAEARGEQDEAGMRSALAWDQHHTFTANLGYMSRNGFLVNFLAKIYGSAIAPDWMTNDQQNLLARHELDFKISLPLQLGNNLRLEPFVEVHNFLNERFAVPGEGGLDFSQPTAFPAQQFGRRIWVGFVYR